MKKLWCLLGVHSYSKWEHVGMKGKYEEKLKRRCINCGKLDYYDGIVETCIETGEKSPYVFKN